MRNLNNRFRVNRYTTLKPTISLTQTRTEAKSRAHTYQHHLLLLLLFFCSIYSITTGTGNGGGEECVWGKEMNPISLVMALKLDMTRWCVVGCSTESEVNELERKAPPFRPFFYSKDQPREGNMWWLIRGRTSLFTHSLNLWGSWTFLPLLIRPGGGAAEDESFSPVPVWQKIESLQRSGGDYPQETTSDRKGSSLVLTLVCLVFSLFHDIYSVCGVCMQRDY